MPEPAAVLHRYTKMLSEHGALMVSMFECLPASLTWWKLRHDFTAADNVRIQNRKGLRWQVRELVARSR